MNILFIASRPPWPPTDGGRVLMAYTVEGLLDALQRHYLTTAANAASAPQSP